MTCSAHQTIHVDDGLHDGQHDHQNYTAHDQNQQGLQQRGQGGQAGLDRQFLLPRGLLEFWVDPESPYFKPVFADESREFVLFCGGGWRSALAARSLHEMGMRNVAHMEGGFGAWKQAGAPLETWADHQAASARRKSIR